MIPDETRSGSRPRILKLNMVSGMKISASVRSLKFPVCSLFSESPKVATLNGLEVSHLLSLVS